MVNILDVTKLGAPVVHTPGRGIHVIFKQPKSPLGNGAGALPDGIDVRGDGGYIIAPNAICNERRYLRDFRTPLLAQAIQSKSIPELPEALETLIRNAPASSADNGDERAVATDRSDPTARQAAYAAAALKDSARELAETRRPGRNNKLNKSAFRLGTMVARGWISRDAVRAELVGACRSNGLFGDGPAAVHATITSGLEAGLKQPHPNLRSTTASKGQHSKISGSRLDVVRASEVRPENIDWLWPSRIARGKHTMIAGTPGTGKSQLTISIAAAVTTGGAWPCGEGRAPLGHVIILSAEDGVADTIIPRLLAAGADLSRVQIVKATCSEDGEGRRTFNLQTDLNLLESKINQLEGDVLVIIDPSSAYMGSKLDSHKNVEVRGVLAPIGEMAERTGAAVLSVTHLTKGSAGKDSKALDRVIGSIAFTAAPRMGFLVTEDPHDKDRRLFLHIKNNLARSPQGLAFRLGQTMVGESRNIPASFVDWEEEPVSISAEEALNSRQRDSTATTGAIEFLQTVLAEGPKRARDIEEQAKEAGLLGRTESLGQSKPFRAARIALGITPYQQKGEKAGGWVWALPRICAQ